MKVLTLVSAQRGIRKISLTKLLQARLSLRLSVAKAAVDDLLEGRTVRLSVPDGVDANGLAQEIRQLRAACEISDQP